MKINFKRAGINFVLAYLVVTILAYGVSFLAEIIFQLPSMEELGVTMFESPTFVMTVPYHLLINFLVWTGFSWLYFRKAEGRTILFKEYLHLALFWLVLAMLTDLIAFVLIKSPFSLTPHQFYVEYQPWISLTYLIVLVSPLVYGAVSTLGNKNVARVNR
jgi:hypothetical protein